VNLRKAKVSLGIILKNLCAHQSINMKEMDKFLGTSDLPKLNQVELKNLKRVLTSS
jgi:hypothetical protein